MNLKDLKYLIALSDYRHFGKAAKASFVSQPALSMQIKKLEQTLGVQLLERTNKTVLLTDIGNAVVERARSISICAEEIREITKLARDPESGYLSFGLFPTLGPYLLPHIFPKLSEPFPNLQIYLLEAKTHELLEKIKQGKLDVALLALPIPDADLTTLPLFEEAFMLGVSHSHPLAKKINIQLSDLNKTELLLLEEGHCLRNQALALCAEIATPATKSFYATSLETLRYMVASNIGNTLIPALARRPGDGITYLPFNEPDKPGRTIGMVFRNSSARSSLLHKIAKQIKITLAEANLSNGITIIEQTPLK